jgi:hypothetical protein
MATIEHAIPLEQRKAEARRLRDEEGWSTPRVAELFGIHYKTVWRWIGPAPDHRSVSKQERKQIRELRYLDGLSCGQVFALTGRNETTVRKIAPGWPGKIDNTRLREAFLASGLTAGEVARRVGWYCSHGSRGVRRDHSRVKRTLGVTRSSNGHGRSNLRRLIDAETAALLAEAIGVAPWEVGCLDD